MKANPRTVRLEKDLDNAVNQWTEINHMDFSKLSTLAIEDYITKNQSIELKPISMEEATSAASRIMKRHKQAIDELK
jgi:hypothetical protein